MDGILSRVVSHQCTMTRRISVHRAKAVLFDSDFLTARTQEHGGNHRTAQLVELLVDAGYEVISVRHASSEGNQFIQYFRGLSKFARVTGRICLARSKILTWARNWESFERVALARPEARICLWEQSDRFDTFAASVTAARPVIAVPQNIEALVLNPSLPKRAIKVSCALAAEVDRLRRCAAVFTITNEERWLLAGFGIDAVWLPYYPPRSIAQKLEAVRATRKLGGRRLLLFGNVHNPPTRDGLVAAAQMLAQLQWKTGDAAIWVAGLGTETLASTLPADRFELLGTITSDQLRDLQVQIRAIVVYQRYGAGYLTRVTEFLMAGVPVIGNGIALRSSAHLSGVSIFETKEELQELLARPLPLPQPLSYPRTESARFMAVIDALAKP